MTRSESKQALLEELGAVPVVADALEADQVAEAVARARPDVIVHQLTAIPETVDMRHPERAFELTNRLRTEGTDHLLSAGQAVGVRRFVAQSNVAAYARTGAAVKSEEDPVDTSPVGAAGRERGGDPPPRTGGARRDVDAGDRAPLRVVLRPRHVDGPGPGVLRTRPQAQVPAGRQRWRRVVVHPHRRRRGGDAWRRSSTAAAGSTTSSTTTRPRSPSGCRRWPSSSAPRSRCAFRASSGSMFAGEFGVMLMTEIRGASNAKAKRELAWRPRHPSWRQGFAAA